jgi:hypothetical protein
MTAAVITPITSLLFTNHPFELLPRTPSQLSCQAWAVEGIDREKMYGLSRAGY